MEVGWFMFLGWRVGLEWSQARWFEIPLLDGGDFQSFFRFPHKREIVIERFGEVVEWDEHCPQNLVLHKEDHGYL